MRKKVTEKKWKRQLNCKHFELRWPFFVNKDFKVNTFKFKVCSSC